MLDEKGYYVDYGQRSIEFSIQRRDRKTLAISVLPDLSVWVTAPLDCSEDAIREKVQKRSRWILEKQRWFAQFQSCGLPRFYVGGETHRYLGKRYRLKIVVGLKAHVRLHGGCFIVSGPDTLEPRAIMSALDDWYRKHATRMFGSLVGLLIEKFGLHAKPRIVVRKMKTRWGSVAASGVMTFNIKLIQAPTECIEYVVAHEVCHLVHFGHTQEFYAALSSLMPDWEQRKEHLEKNWE